MAVVEDHMSSPQAVRYTECTNCGTHDRDYRPQPTHSRPKAFVRHLGVCPICLRTFATIPAATAHRDSHGRCLDPEGVTNLVELDGIWMFADKTTAMFRRPANTARVA
ncbi:MAG: hypothetical protein ACRDZ8_21540 [Acidimicrobiales bacterium]